MSTALIRESSGGLKLTPRCRRRWWHPTKADDPKYHQRFPEVSSHRFSSLPSRGFLKNNLDNIGNCPTPNNRWESKKM